MRDLRYKTALAAIISTSNIIPTHASLINTLTENTSQSISSLFKQYYQYDRSKRETSEEVFTTDSIEECSIHSLSSSINNDNVNILFCGSDFEEENCSSSNLHQLDYVLQLKCKDISCDNINCFNDGSVYPIFTGLDSEIATDTIKFTCTNKNHTLEYVSEYEDVNNLSSLSNLNLDCQRQGECRNEFTGYNCDICPYPWTGEFCNVNVENETNLDEFDQNSRLEFPDVDFDDSDESFVVIDRLNIPISGNNENKDLTVFRNGQYICRAFDGPSLRFYKEYSRIRLSAR